MQVILTHDHTDFDAVASQLGAWVLQPESVPVVGRLLNRNVRDFLLLHGGALPFVQDEELSPDEPIEQALLVDTQALPSLKGVDSQAIPRVTVVDHHAPRDDLPPHWTRRLEQTGSCATLFVEGIAERGLTLDWVQATLLLLGIHEDTGSLAYVGSTARDARAAAWLMEQGADLDTLRRFLEHPLSERQRLLYSRLVEGAETLDINGFPVVVARASMDEYVDDVSSLAHPLRELYDPAALLLAVHMSDHVQLVARSTTDEIDVGQLMREWGGGGHPRAAAAFVEGATLDEVVAQLWERLPPHVRPAATVGQWMSGGKIRTLPATARVEEAFQLMQRWGHEGFPVLGEQGEVVGLLTRRDVDRALHHQLHRAPVTEFMHRGELSVTPDDSVAHARRVMTEAAIGQLPVVAPGSGTLVGIITRTDLLARQHGAPTDSERHTLMARVGQALGPATLALVRQVARRAQEAGHHAYLVGGIVRDLLLAGAGAGPARDLDIVIEGNAIAVARALADSAGGRVVAHERFGTAKWLLPDTFPAQWAIPPEPLPPHLDLITARTEFYERPTALPQVEQASIKQDLHRRDFTLNTLAISLDPAREGHLFDFYGGRADLERGLIRVLHNLSFVEDPTRILRAIRFEQRFRFALEPRTLELLRGSLDLLEQVSPDRLRHELVLILQEKEPERTLARLDELGILRRLMPDVRWEEGDSRRFARLRQAGIGDPMAFLSALVWDPQAEQARIDRVAERLALPNEWRARLHTLYEVRAEAATLTDPDLPPSALHARLRPRDPLALSLLALLTEDEVLRRSLRFFLDDLRHRAPLITGDDLRAAGLPPGPAYKRLLDTLHSALLDGHAPDEASQRALLATLLAEP